MIRAYKYLFYKLCFFERMLFDPVPGRFNLRAALLVFASVALCAGVMKHRADLLKPHVVQDTGAMWLFPAPGTRIDFRASSREALLIRDWITTHQTGWKFSSSLFDPSKTQIICGTYGIELVDDMILLDYSKHKDDDPDSAIHFERVLSPDEQAFWQSLIQQIRRSFPAEHYRDWKETGDAFAPIRLTNR